MTTGFLAADAPFLWAQSTATNTPTNTPTLTLTIVVTNTPSPSMTSTFTQTPWTHTRTPTSTPTNTPTNSPTNSPTKTVTATTTPFGTATPTPAVIQLALGPAEPANSIQSPGAANIPALQLQVTNNSNVAVTLTGLKLTASGSGDDAAGITLVSLYLDGNNNGLLDGGDSLVSIATYNADNGTASFAGSDLLAPLGVNNYLVTYSFSGTAPNGTYQPRVAVNADVTGVDAAFGFPVWVFGAPVTGAIITLGGPTPTWTWTITPTPAISVTPTITPTPSGPVTLIYVNGSSACAGALGCSVTIVDQCRQLQLDSTTSYMIMRICALCGVCQPSDIMTMRLTKSWDEICAYYGIDWTTFVVDLQARINTLKPEIDTPAQLIRGAANDPSSIPYVDYCSMPATLTTGSTFKEVCPLCP